MDRVWTRKAFASTIRTAENKTRRIRVLKLVFFSEKVMGKTKLDII